MTSHTLPQHFRYIRPIVEALRGLGGSGSSSEVTEMVIEKLKINDDELNDLLPSGGSRIKKQIHWARMVLVKVGFIDSSQRGVWILTEKGMGKYLTEDDLVQLYRSRKNWAGLGSRKTKKEENYESDTGNETTPEKYQENENNRSELLKILQSISPSGFEKLCQLMLRESSFEKVTVTGKSGDGGIDGHGVLQVNPFALALKYYFNVRDTRVQFQPPRSAISGVQ